MIFIYSQSLIKTHSFEIKTTYPGNEGSKSERLIQISAHLSYVGVKFEQVATRKIAVWKELNDSQVQLVTSLRSSLPEKVATRNIYLTISTKKGPDALD